MKWEGRQPRQLGNEERLWFDNECGWRVVQGGNIGTAENPSRMGNKQTEWESTLVGQEADLQEWHEEEKKNTLRVFENLYGEWLYRGTDDGLVVFLAVFFLSFSHVSEWRFNRIRCAIW